MDGHYLTAVNILSQILTYLLFLLAIPWGCLGQELRFQQFTMEDGLSNSGSYWLESIIQDREGFMWFTTFNGLNRFDGVHFKKFQYNQKAPKSLGNNFTTAICEAEDGRIWVGTSSGIYIFDPETETFDRLQKDPSNPKSLCGNDINFIGKDGAGNMWVGTAAEGVCRWSKETGLFDDFGGYFKDGLVFFQQKNGTIWVGNTQGLHQKMAGKDEFRPVTLPSDFIHKNIRFASDIVELPDGRLMVSSNGYGLWTYYPKASEFKDLTASFQSEISKSPYSMLMDKSGIVWMGAIGEIHRYDPATGLFTVFRHDQKDPAGVPMHTVAYGYQDAAGSLWFITPGGGVIVSHSPDHPFEILGNIDDGEIIRLDENRLLINSRDHLGVFDLCEQKFVASEIPAGLLNAETVSIAFSGKKELWVQQARADQVKVFNFETRKITAIPGRVPWLKTGPEGRIWSGFKYFDETKKEWVDIYPQIAGLPAAEKVGAAVTDIHFGDRGVVWLATNAGIFKYHLDTGQGIKYKLHPEDNLAANVIHRIYPGEEGRFYLSTSNGMSRYDPAADRFRSYNESNGLLHNQVTSVVEDARGNPWIATPKGLHQLDLSIGAFSHYDINDGLPGIFFNYQRAFRDDKTGHLYFSVTEKLIRFHPDSLKTKTYAAPIHLLDFYLRHEVVRPDENGPLSAKELRFHDKIQLRPGQTDFGFSFVMPVFYKTLEVEYFYQLTPYDADWTSAGADNEIHYTNMDPGKYTFRVKAKTADGFWSPNEAGIIIRILPPFYRTWWAYLIYILAIGGIFWSIRRFELRRESMKAEAKRIQDLDTLKSRLYTNITHEFRTPLTVIMGMAGNIKGHTQEKKLIRRNSENLLRLINQLLDLSKLDAGVLKVDAIQADIVHYLQYITESFYSMAHEKQIRLTFYTEVKTLFMDYDEVKLQHIVYNLLSNAIKFTPQGGKVIMHLRELERDKQPWLQIKVSDTGVGIAEEHLPHIFDRFYQVEQQRADDTTDGIFSGAGIGLALTKELVELMGGRIAVESEVGTGTDFIILLPSRQEAATLKKEPGFGDLPRIRDGEGGPDGVSENLVSAFEENMVDPDKDRPSLLIIEDNRDMITYIQSLLKADYQIETALNGQEGIYKALESIPDIIISDVMMPEKDGYEACRVLKNDERTSHIPIILLTAKAIQEDRIAGLKVGADAYLVKPFHKEELLARLEQLVKLRRSLQAHYTSGELFSTNIPTNKVPSLDEVFLQKLIKVVQEQLNDPDLSVDHLCRAVRRSNTQVNRKLKALTGKTPSMFIRAIRLHRAVELLQTTDLNVSEIAYQVGFSDPNYFSRSFSEEFGYAPHKIRK